MLIQTVLMVDDDQSIRMIANLSLTRVGKWQVFLAASGSEAVELALQLNPDVILLDVMMPRMDGPTTLKLMRQHPQLSQTPVIFMTAKVLREEMESYAALGAAGIITKPFDPMKLPGQITEIASRCLTRAPQSVC